MKKELVVNASEIMPYSPPESRGLYESRLLIEPEGMGSTKLGLTQATIKPGAPSGEGESHPVPYDEAYYILRGMGRVSFPDLGETHEVGPDDAVFIPAGTKHGIQNTGEEDLVFLGIVPIFPVEEGINPVIDGRRREWGTSFRKIDPEG
jgi:mannose-6-phosphate isomerase-like protein (cupin superfamily)